MDFDEPNLYNHITSLLMENGASATKEAVNAVIGLIQDRDSHLFERLSVQLERHKQQISQYTQKAES